MPRHLQPCGTYAAWQRHRKHGETPCAPCVEAFRARSRDDARRRTADPAKRVRWNQYRRERYRRRRDAAGLPSRRVPECGTQAGRNAHTYRREPYCLTCAWSVAVTYRRHLAPCGTDGAAQRHRDRDETCQACRVDGRTGRTVSQPHGTPSALRRHEYHREQPCEPCREVRRQIMRDRRARAKQRRSRGVPDPT